MVAMIAVLSRDTNRSRRNGSDEVSERDVF